MNITQIYSNGGWGDKCSHKGKLFALVYWWTVLCQKEWHKIWKIELGMNFVSLNICIYVHFLLTQFYSRMPIPRSQWITSVCDQKPRWWKVPLHSLCEVFPSEQFLYKKPCGVQPFSCCIHLSLWSVWTDFYNKNKLQHAQVKKTQT